MSAINSPYNMAKIGGDDKDFFTLLAAPVPPEEIEWRPGQHYERDGKHSVSVLAYMTNRFVMERLDTVAGPGNWKNEFARSPIFDVQPGKNKVFGIMCGLSIKVNGEWITKWDAAEPSDIEPAKGAHSDAQKRAAVQWGIGRGLYYAPRMYAPAKQAGNSWAIDYKNWSPTQALMREWPEYLKEYAAARKKYESIYRAQQAAPAPTDDQREEMDPDTLADMAEAAQSAPATPSGDTAIVSGGKRAGRTSTGYAQSGPAAPVAQAPPNWKQGLAPMFGTKGGVTFTKSGEMKNENPITMSEINALGQTWTDHWTSTTGNLGKAGEIATLLASYGYFMNPQEVIGLRKCFTVTMDDKQLEAQATAKTTKGKYPGLTYMEMAQGKAQGSAELISDLMKLDTPPGEVARYVMKKHLATPKPPPAKPAAPPAEPVVEAKKPAARKSVLLGGRRGDDGLADFKKKCLELAQKQREDADDALVESVCQEFCNKGMDALTKEEREEFLLSLSDTEG